MDIPLSDVAVVIMLRLIHDKMVGIEGNMNLINPTLSVTVHKYAYIALKKHSSCTIYLDVIFDIKYPFLDGLY